MAGGIVVFAYSALGHACLKALIERGENIAALFTHVDDPAERAWFASCADLARAHGIPVHTAEPADGDEVGRTVAAAAPDLMFSFYYRRMIPTAILAHAAKGAFNMHGSLLPKYRGRAPVNWAVLHGETETGVTLHRMTGRADAGCIVDREAVAIGPADTAGEVMERMVPAAVAVLLRRIDALKAGTAPCTPQDDAAASYFGGRRPEDGRIDWALPARDIVNLVRAVAPPFPGAFSEHARGRLMVWRAREAAGSGPPGVVLGVDPVVVAAGENAVELQEFEFAAASGAGPGRIPVLAAGDRLGEAGSGAGSAP